MPLSIVLTLTAGLATVQPAAQADAPQVGLSPAELSQFSLDADFVRSLSKNERRSVLQFRDAKGNPIFRPKALANEPDLWATLDPAVQSAQGTATETAYKKFGSGTREVIVAVLDSGGDLTHPDLAGKIWTNAGETGKDAQGRDKSSNGIDDDGNGYVDDVHGWNFLGGLKDGKIVNVIGNTLEVTREYKRLLPMAEAGALSDSDRAYFDGIEKLFEQESRRYGSSVPALRALDKALVILEQVGLASTTELTEAAINALPTPSVEVLRAKQVVLEIIQLNPGLTPARVREALPRAIAMATATVNLVFESSSIVGDDPHQLQPVCATAWEFEKDDCLEAGYGNNDVTGVDERGSLSNSDHGTHVAGIIAAIRGNPIGIEGQADKVKIMHVRMVPDGDERDKDVANAIRYAVDNGAKVINMSFGKPLSPNKDWVDDAVRYAESKGVLLVHAAGNSNFDTQEANRVNLPPRQHNFPNKNFYDAVGNVIGQASNWLEVGASSRDLDAYLAAEFSNYGKSSVDLFAPGNCVVSTTPNNTYACYPGTSMASPEVAGVVAYVMSVFPKATMSEIVQAILSQTTQYPNLKVYQPGSFSEVPFASLSVSGGIVNAYKAALNLSQNR